jgi:hypothetical protein
VNTVIEVSERGTMGGEKLASHDKGRKSRESTSREFAHSLSREVIDSETKSHALFARELRNLEKHYLMRLDSSPELCLEVRRRISVRLLDHAILVRCKQSVCRARMNAANALGYADLGQKTTYSILYAKWAFAQGNKRVARRVATEVIDELEKSLKKRNSTPLRQCLAFAKRFEGFISRAAEGVSSRVDRIEEVAPSFGPPRR